MARTGTYNNTCYAIIDGQLMVVYRLMKNGRYDAACNVLNDIVRNIRYTKKGKYDIAILSRIVDESYRALVDIAMGRYEGAHHKVRNMHYSLVV